VNMNWCAGWTLILTVFGFLCVAAPLWLRRSHKAIQHQLEQNMKEIPPIVLIIAAIAMGSGCASIGQRCKGLPFDSPPPAGAFPGVRADARFAVAGIKEDASQWPSVFVRGPMALVDFPFSFTLDAICLPWDLNRERRERVSKTVEK
jgi:uncharacterized protein YceK